MSGNCPATACLPTNFLRQIMGMNDIINAIKERVGLVAGPLLYNAVIIVGICIFFAAASFYWLFPVLRAIDQNISEAQNIEAQNADALLNLLLDETFSHLIHFGEHAYEDRGIEPRASVLSQSRPDFLNLAVFGTDGKLSAFTSRNGSQEAPYKLSDSVNSSYFFQEAIRNQRYIGPVLLSAAGPSIQIAQALTKDGEIVAVATSEIDFSLLWEVTKKIPVKDGKIYLVDKLGTIIADPDIDRTRSGENLKYRNVVDLLVQGKANVLRDNYKNENGENVLAFGLKMQKTGWGIVVEKNEEKAMKQRNDTLLVALVFTAASILLITLLILSTLRLAWALVNIDREKSERERTIAYLPDGVVEFTGENRILGMNPAAKNYLNINQPLPDEFYVIESAEPVKGFERLKKIFFSTHKTEGGQGSSYEVSFDHPERLVLQIITVYIKGLGPLKDQRYLKIIHDVTHERQ